MDNKCPGCGATLSTSQVIIPLRRKGTIIYQTQRRCTGCFKAVIVKETSTPPVDKHQNKRCSREELRTTHEDGY